MRHEPNLRIEQYRDNSHPLYVSEWGKNHGSFLIPTADGNLRVLSSGFADLPEATGWEHVSVSCSRRTPTWEEMDRVKKRFGRHEEIVV